MPRYLLNLLLLLLFCSFAAPSPYLGSREGDPESLVEDVSVIQGDYTEVEVDLTIPAPDSLVLSRFYSSRDTREVTNFGGWRFVPHCFLRTESDSGSNRMLAYVGNPEGSIVTYSSQRMESAKGPISLQVDPEACAALSNTARGAISLWTNLRKNELIFDPQSDTFELRLCSLGKRFYKKHPTLTGYVITYEVLPSGNKVFYEFDEEGRITLIKETNAKEMKVLAWIKFNYDEGVHALASDGKEVHYTFQQTSSEIKLLTAVHRSHKPDLSYQYHAFDSYTLLVQKTLPEGRYVAVSYDEKSLKVKGVTLPLEAEQKSTLTFTYEKGETHVFGPGQRHSVYRFDENHQLIAVEERLDEAPYRIRRKTWSDGNLLSSSLEDGMGNLFYHKRFLYSEGNLEREEEYGDAIGEEATPLILDDLGQVTNQIGAAKNYFYFSGKQSHGFFEYDDKKNGVKYWYQKGTQLLMSKCILRNGSLSEEEKRGAYNIQERNFYTYNEDATLIETVTDDGIFSPLLEDEFERKSGVNERKITRFYPKKEMPNLGAPEIIEERYGIPSSSSDALLKKTVFTFDSEGNAISQALYDMADTLVYTLHKEYSHGLLISETDPLGYEKRYRYDANRNLASEFHANTSLSIEYQYNLRNWLTATIKRVKSGRAYKTWVSFDALGNITSEIDPWGRETLYTYDTLSRCLQVAYPAGQIYTYTYDLLDHPISVTDPRGRITISSYNIRGNPLKTHHYDGTQELFTYNSSGQITSHGSKGITEKLDYNSRGQLIHYERQGRRDSPFTPKLKVDHVYEGFHKTSEESTVGGQSIYSYDAAGRLVSLTCGSQRTDFTYDNVGRVHTLKRWTTSKEFYLILHEYDVLGRVIEERVENSQGKFLLKKKYAYNEAGHLSQIIGYPQNHEIVLSSYQYDDLGRLIQVTPATGYPTYLTYEEELNEQGERIQKRTLIDPLGTQIEELFTLEGELIKVIKKDKAGNLLSESSMSYDIMGNKISESLGGYQLSYAFNDSDQLISSRGPKELAAQFEYNNYGERISKKTPAFKDPVIYQYNNEGFLGSLEYRGEGPQISYCFSYDPLGHVTDIYNDDLSIEYELNNQHLPLSEKITLSYESYTVGMAYDSEGKIQTLQLPDGSAIKYLYDGPQVQKIVRYGKDKKEQYAYEIRTRDLMGHICEELLPSGIERRQEWDLAARKVAITTEFFQDRVTEYDPLSNITQKAISQGPKTALSDYTYDALSQLIAERGSLQQSYRYDPLGNRLQKNNVFYQVSEANELFQADETAYAFDLNGNVVTKTAQGKSWIFESNILGQIVSIKNPTPSLTLCTYDPLGRRLMKKVVDKSKKTVTRRFFYLGATELGALNEKGEIVELKIPSDPNQPESSAIAIEIQGKTYVPLYDLQGNVACLIDTQNRTPVETYQYSAFGEECIINSDGGMIDTSSVHNPWRYRGKRVDEESGLVYFGYRYYDPKVGRWLTPDPAGPLDSLNLYLYARNNPLSYVDLFGLASEMGEPCQCGFCVRQEGFCHCLTGDYGHPRWGSRCDCSAMNCSHKLAKSASLMGHIGNAGYGVAHGTFDFFLKSLHELETAAAFAGSAELDIPLFERLAIIEAVQQTQADRVSAVEVWVSNAFNVDPSDHVYQMFRAGTTVGLEVGSLVVGGYGVVKGVVGAVRLARVPSQATLLGKTIRIAEPLVNRGASFAGSKRFPLSYAPYQTVRNQPTVINGKSYTGHALDRMQDRGLTPSIIEYTINTGHSSPANFPGGIKYYDPANKIRAIVGENAQIITIIPGKG